MMRLIIFVLVLTGCRPDETVSAYGAEGIEWHLLSIDSTKFGARATLEFPKPGRIAGHGPCNRYFATQESPYPWFEAKDFGATKMACGDLAKERAFFGALQNMTLSEVSGGTLILSTPEGREMVFGRGVD